MASEDEKRRGATEHMEKDYSSETLLQLLHHHQWALQDRVRHVWANTGFGMKYINFQKPQAAINPIIPSG